MAPHKKDSPPEIPRVVIAQAQAAATASNEEDDITPSASTAPLQEPSSSSKNIGGHGQEAPTKSSKSPSSYGYPISSSKPNPHPHDPPIEQRPAPAYGNEYGQVDFNQEGFDTSAQVAHDGRLNIRINQKSKRLSDLLVPALRSQLNLAHQDEPATHPPGYIPPSLGGPAGQEPPPPLNVVIHVVGSRGDVQPFVALGKVLKETYHHRVRLATHSTFRGFVEENGLEYFNIGGDPAELMAFMVKNPGLMPGMDTLKSGDIGKRRKGMYEIVQGCWRSCIETGDGTGIAITDDSMDTRTSFDSGIGLEDDPATKPFVADAIIANPPSFAHVHCAEKLGIPLHLMFTMPWSPTQAFPHPLANIQSSNADPTITNFVSYALVEMMTWQGLGDIINRFREKSLGLEPVSLMWAPGMAARLRIPYTYCWSPSLIPKPKDWGSHISISGFYFLSLASSFTPEPDLEAFLDAGPPPVYIGFGSIVVDDPNAMTKLIFEAVKKTGQRALVSKGWGGFGGDALGIPEGVFMLGNVPHDWLFKKVSCVVHHGGAGTTAAGIALGKPTVIVPFFGDQPFWGAMVAKAGAGPKPIPSKQLNADNLAAGIMEALKPATLARAQELGAKISSEKGTDVGAKDFNDKLDVDSLRCSLAPSRAATWRVKRTKIRLSAFAATTLGNEGLLNFNDLKLFRPREYDSEDGPWDPISGGASAILGTFGSLMMGAADFPVEILRAMKIKPSEASNAPGSQATSSTEVSKTASSSKESVEFSDTLSSPVSRSLEDVREGRTQFQDQATSPSTEVPAPHAEQLSPTTSKDSHCPPRAMASALRGSLSRASSGSRSRHSSPSRAGPTGESKHQRRHSGQITLEAALGAGKGIGRMSGALAKSPMDFTMGVARGFHNAPKLYGDRTVRQSEKVTDLQSGLKAAGKEFGYGMFDGISGIVTQPIEGAKKEGVAGFIKGFGKGIGGIVLKPSAAFFGLPGYTLKGVYKEIQKHLGSSVQNYIVAARTTQGFQEWNESNREERLDVISRWQAMQVDLAKQKEHHRHASFHAPHGLSRSPHSGGDERKTRGRERKGEDVTAADSTVPPGSSVDDPLSHFATAPSLSHSTEDDFEEAIKASVAATSKGNPEEDQMIERAIRASVMELQSASRGGDDEAAIQKAIKASIKEAQLAKAGFSGNQDGTEEHDKHLEKAIEQSLHEHGHLSRARSAPNDGVFDDSGIESEGEEHVRAAIERSKTEAGGHAQDEELHKAIELSKRAHDDHAQESSKTKTEEEIVLEYVRKQSLLEEEHRQKMDPATASAESHDQELERAMQASLDLKRNNEQSPSKDATA